MAGGKHGRLQRHSVDAEKEGLTTSGISDPAAGSIGLTGQPQMIFKGDR